MNTSESYSKKEKRKRVDSPKPKLNWGLDNVFTLCYNLLNMRFTKKEIKPLAEMKKPSKVKKYFYGFAAIVILIIIATSAYGVYEFNYNYSLQSPITLRSPIVSKHRDILISPVAKGKKTSSILDLGKIADKIYILESSGGKNDSCKNLGLFNGFGFRQNTSEWICYSSHEEVRQLVINWLTTHIAKYGLEKSLCIYNRGVNETGCTYSQNYLTLK